MPRRPRIHIDGVPLHIVQRGHNRGACFFDDQDRHAYLSWLREALQRMALNQDQPIGNSRFYAEIEAMTGQRRELRKQGRSRKKNQNESMADTGQQQLPLRTN